MPIVEKHGLQKEYEDLLTERTRGKPVGIYLQAVRDLRLECTRGLWEFGTGG
jgi:hypothetical protein